MKGFVRLIICLLAFFSTVELSAQIRYEIVGPDVVPLECCEWYEVDLRDSTNTNIGVWTLCDNSGNFLDSLSSRGSIYRFELCPSKYNVTGGFILKFIASTPNQTIKLERFIEVDFQSPLQVFTDYQCVVRDSGCTELCVGEIGIYSVEINNPDQVEWFVNGGTIIKDEGWSISVKWDRVGKHTLTAIDNTHPNCPSTFDICIEVLPVPAADFQSSPAYDAQRELTICKGQTIYLEDLTVDARRIRWNFGNGITSDQRTTDHTFNEPGDYEIILIADNGCSCKDTSMMTVKVLDAISPTLTCVGTTCPAETNTYYVQNACSETVWTISANGTIEDGGQLTDDFITVTWHSGPYGVITILGQNCPPGYCPEPTVVRIPVISGDGPITGDDEVCINQIETYRAPFFQGTEYYWTVSNGGSVVGNSTGSHVTIQWDRVNAPDHQQWVEVVYDNCYLECGGNDRMDVSVLGRFALEGKDKFCENAAMDFNTIQEGSSTPVNANWKLVNVVGSTLDDANSVSTFSPSTALAPGIYYVFAEVNSGDYCDPILEKKIVVQANPNPPVGILTEPEVCKNALHEMNVDQLNPAFIVVWGVDDGGNYTEFENETSLRYSFKTDGPYKISVWYKEPGGLGCASDKVEQVLGTYQFAIAGDADACQEVVSVYETTSNKPSGFDWSIVPADAGVIKAGQGDKKVEIYWTQPGNHEVRLEHCGNEEKVAVEVYAKPMIAVNHPTHVCEGETEAVSLGQNYAKIEWYDSQNALVANGQNVALGAGNYVVKVETAQGCKDDETFVIHGRPAPDAIISFPDIRAFCDVEPFQPRTLYANTDGNYQYQWFRDGMPAGNGPTVKATFFGRYHCIMTNQFGCEKRSNDLFLHLDCDDNAARVCNGNCKKRTCPTGVDLAVDILDVGINCNKKKLTSFQKSQILSHKWFVEDLRNNGWNELTDLEPEHTFLSAGHHMVILDALIRLNSGVTCQIQGTEMVKIPVAAWFAADQACVNAPTHFEDLSTFISGESITSHSWDFGDPSSGASNASSDEDPSHVYDTPGKYTVKLTITAASGCISEYEEEIEVYDLPTLNFNLPAQLCVGAALEVTAPANLLDITWEFGDPMSAPNNMATSEVAYHSFEQVGNYMISLSGKNVFGCEETVQRNLQIIDVANKENIVVDGNNPLCAGQSLTLRGPVNATKWQWSNGEITQDIQVSTPGDYSVKVETADGCRYETPVVNITVNPNPSVVAVAHEMSSEGAIRNSSAVQLEICQGDMAQLEALSQDHYRFSWSNGRNQRFFDLSAFTAPGTYPFTVVVTDPATGCTSTSNEVKVVVHPTPPAPSIASTPTGLLCENQDIKLKVTNFNSQYSYVWSNGMTGEEISVSGAGHYTVSAYNQFGCEEESNSIRIFPAPNADVVMSGCLVRCDPDTICLPAMNDVTQFQWYKDGNAIPAPEGTIKDFVATESGTYRLMVTNAFGCSDISDELNLEVTPGYGDLTVTVYLDVNDNGIIDAGDTPLKDMVVRITDPDMVDTDDISDLAGQVIWRDKKAGIYSADVINDTLEIVMLTNEAEIIGCGDPFNIDLLMRKKCPDFLQQIDTSICSLDTLFFLDSSFTTEGLHVIEKLNSQGCMERTEIQLFFDAPDNDITITVYLDINNNGKIDKDDKRFPGIEVVVTKNGLEIHRGRSDFDGLIEYGIDELTDYIVYVDSTLLGPKYKIILGDDLAVFDQCNEDKELQFLIQVLDTDVFAPNVFTPNGDNTNDKFRVFTKNPDDRVIYFAVYDRWGELVFENTDVNEPQNVGWDGTLNGELMNPGVFVYHVEVENFIGEVENLVGDVTLLK